MKWIAIEDRLPKQGTVVLLGSTEHDFFLHTVAQKDGFITTAQTYTHWAAPTPPRKKNSGAVIAT